MSAQDETQPIIIKKVKKGGGGHHGGAWKVAYADFVTAMMAFFLLLWLLNVTTSQQKQGIADYFDPNPKISDSRSGAGGLMGGLTVNPEGAMTNNVNPLAQQQSQNVTNPALRPGQTPGSKQAGDGGETNKKRKAAEAAKAKKRRKEQAKFDAAQKALEEAIQKNPELKKVAQNIRVDSTPEGLRIQVLDQEGESMFARGSAEMFQKTRTIMEKIAEIILTMDNQVSVRGHTDGIPYGAGATYTNWELSADRANSSRRVLLQSGVPENRLNDVVGKADTEHLYPENPADARNRRISIVLLKEELTNPDYDKEIEESLADLSGEEQEDDSINDVEIPPLPMPFDEPLFEKSAPDVQFP